MKLKLYNHVFHTLQFADDHDLIVLCKKYAQYTTMNIKEECEKWGLTTNMPKLNSFV